MNNLSICLHPFEKDMPYHIIQDGVKIASFDCYGLIHRFGREGAAKYLKDFCAALTSKPLPDTAAYAPGNQASKEAARKIKVKLTGIRGRVFTYIKSCGQNGATGSEVADVLNLLPYTAKPRCSELRDAGMIRDSGRMRENKNGGKETVWILAVDSAPRSGDNPATL